MTDKEYKELGFECPKCDCLSIEEVCGVNGVITSTLTAISKKFGHSYEDGPMVDGDTYIVNYQCRNCGWVIPDIDSPEDLYEWLDKQEYNNE